MPLRSIMLAAIASLFLFLLPVGNSLCEANQMSIEEYLSDSETEIVIYIMPLNILTRIPVTSDLLRKNYYYCVRLGHLGKIKASDVIRDLYEKAPKDEKNIRVLFDFIRNEKVVNSFAVSSSVPGLDGFKVINFLLGPIQV